jgi:hypothetical protein
MRTGRRRLAALAFAGFSVGPALSVTALVAMASVVAAPGCARRAARGDLTPPPDAAAWDPLHDIIFDDHYTQTPLELSGRAPGDVIDQRRLAQRLGFADIVALVTVDQVWSRGLHDSVPRQRVDVTIDRVLLGALPKGTRKDQVLELRGGEDLPAALTGRVMLLFVRWAPGEGSGYHHHLMPADDNVLAWVTAMVRHARALGKLDAVEKPRKRRRGRSSGANEAPTSDPEAGSDAPPQ